MLWGSGSCTDRIFRAVARDEQRQLPSLVRDGSFLLLVGPQIAVAAVSYLSKMHFW